MTRSLAAMAPADKSIPSIHRSTRLLTAMALAACLSMSSGCNVFIRQPVYTTASLDYDDLFITSGDGDWNEYEPLAHFEYYNRGTRWWFPQGFIYAHPIERVNIDDAIREHLVPAIREIGGDGAIAMQVEHTPTSWGSPALYILVGRSALGSGGFLHLRATIVKRRDGATER